MLIANNYDSYTVGEMFGQSPTTIQRWVKKFNESGFAGLRDGERPVGHDCYQRNNGINWRKMFDSLLLTLSLFNLSGMVNYYLSI